MQKISLATLKACACLIPLTLTSTIQAESWEAYRIADAGVGTPEDMEDYTLIGISADATVVAGNEVADWNAFQDIGPDEYRFIYPFYWTLGMNHVQEIAPNTDEIISFPNGYRGRVTGISRDGNWIIGEYATAHEKGFHQAFLYSVQDETFEYLGDFGWSTLERLNRDLAPGEYLASEATGITADGSLVVGWARDWRGLPKAFTWSRETGMVKVFDWINIWDDQREDRFLAISPDGKRVVGDRKYLQHPDSKEKVLIHFYSDPNGEGFDTLDSPLDYTIESFSEISGPDNAILGSIRSWYDPEPEPGWFNLPYEQPAVRWHPHNDSYELFSRVNNFRVLNPLSQSDDGKFMTLEYTGIAPCDGPAIYGAVWSQEEGLEDAWSFLSNTLEIDFKEKSIGRLLPSRDASVLVAEVFDACQTRTDALLRIDLTQGPSPLSQVFPKSSYDNGWRSTHLGKFYTKQYPYLWWEGVGWTYVHPDSNPERGIWLWTEDLGWCVNFSQSPLVWDLDSFEWVSISNYSGWFYSDSRGWFKPLEG